MAYSDPRASLAAARMSGLVGFAAEPMHKLRQRVDSSPSYCRVHADEVVQVHFGVSSFNAGVLWGRLSPVPTGVFHVRPVRSEVLQVGVSTNHSKFPAGKSTHAYVREVPQLAIQLIAIMGSDL